MAQAPRALACGATRAASCAFAADREHPADQREGEPGAGGRMETLRRLVAISMAGLALVGAASAATVQVYAGGRLRGAFEPRGEPYAADGPSVSVYLEKR